MRQLATALAVCYVCLALVSGSPASAQDAEKKSGRSKLRVGTFDSRLIATAYVRSEAFAHRLAKMQADLKDAKARGAEKLAKQLAAEGPALQDLIHKQAFSTWPVHDILETIKAEMPEIAKQANVDVIVSKWDVVFQRDGAETVDVTDLMVAPFAPSEETRKLLDGLRSADPVSVEKLKKHN